MGVSYYTYVGPYVRVFNPFKNSAQEYHSCPNRKCSNHKKGISDGFCSKCGSKIERMTRICKERISFDSWDEFGDNPKLRDPINHSNDADYIYFLDDDRFHLTIDGETNTINDMTDKTPAAEVDRFKEIRDKELSKLKKVFGDESVVVKWGVITYVV